MKKNKMVILLALVSVISNMAYANCLSEYDRAIKTLCAEMSFNNSYFGVDMGRPDYYPDWFGDLASGTATELKNKMFYNNGQGRTAMGAIIRSAGRVTVSTAQGVGIGFLTPYAYGVLFTVLGNPGALPAATAVAPMGAFIGGTVGGSLSIFFSVEDSIKAVKIKHLAEAKQLIQAALGDDKAQFEGLYSKLSTKTKNEISLDRAMAFVKQANENDDFCRGGEPMKFGAIKRFFKDQDLSVK